MIDFRSNRAGGRLVAQRNFYMDNISVFVSFIYFLVFVHFVLLYKNNLYTLVLNKLLERV